MTVLQFGFILATLWLCSGFVFLSLCRAAARGDNRAEDADSAASDFPATVQLASVSAAHRPRPQVRPDRSPSRTTRETGMLSQPVV